MYKMVAKHIMRLHNTFRRRWKILLLKAQYGSSFDCEKFHFRKGFSVFIENGALVSIGENVFFNNYCSITARQKVVIGNNCIFGENVKIYDHNHKYKGADLIRLQGFSEEEIIVGEDCWIGSNVTILKGVKIGRHSVIGAGVIVYKNIPENSVVVCKQEVMNKKL